MIFKFQNEIHGNDASSKMLQNKLFNGFKIHVNGRESSKFHVSGLMSF